jgi:hypothetical protein
MWEKAEAQSCTVRLLIWQFRLIQRVNKANYDSIKQKGGMPK